MDRNDICNSASTYPSVALRKESVDRNKYPEPAEQAKALSLSARRAWIEIDLMFADGVVSGCRSPQGERG